VGARVRCHHETGTGHYSVAEYDLENLFKDAQYYGFPTCMAVHGEILSDMEEDIYTWSDIQRLADQRRSNTQLFASNFPQEVKNFSGGQGAANRGNLGVSIDSPVCRVCPGQPAG
jgi:hypothetical protein